MFQSWALLVTNTINLFFFFFVGCRHYATLAYHHQANGLVERANKEVGRHLTVLTNDMRVTTTWSLYLPLVQRIINSQPHGTTGFSPAALVFGCAVNLDRGFIDEFEEGEAPTPRDIVAVQKDLMKAARLNQEQAFNPGPEPSARHAIGATVLVTHPSRRLSKLQAHLLGPFTVTSRTNDLYQLLSATTGRERTYHGSRLRAYDASRTADLREVAAVDDDSYLVEAIIDHRPAATKSETTFLVRWDGYTADDDEWLPYAAVRDLEALDDYLEENPDLSL